MILFIFHTTSSIRQNRTWYPFLSLYIEKGVVILPNQCSQSSESTFSIKYFESLMSEALISEDNRLQMQPGNTNTICQPSLHRAMPIKVRLQAATLWKCVPLKSRCVWYLIIPCRNTGRHNPLLWKTYSFFTFTGNNMILESLCRSVVARNGVLLPLPSGRGENIITECACPMKL